MGSFDNTIPAALAPNLDYVEIGYMLVERDAVCRLIDPPDISFSRVLRRLAETSALAGMVCGDRYHSISDPERGKSPRNTCASSASC